MKIFIHHILVIAIVIKLIQNYTLLLFSVQFSTTVIITYVEINVVAQTRYQKVLNSTVPHNSTTKQRR